MKQLIVYFLIIVCLGATSCKKKVRVMNSDDEVIPVRMVGADSLLNPSLPPPPPEKRVTDYMLIIQPDTSIVAYIRTQVGLGWEPVGGIIPYGKQYAQAMIKR